MILHIEGSDQDQQAAQELLQEQGFNFSMQSGDNVASTELSETSEETLPLAFVEHSIDGIVIMDIETAGVIYTNNAFAEMLGYSKKEVRRLKIWDWDAVWSREEIEEMCATRNFPGEHFESRHRRKDGRVLEVNISLTQHAWQGKEVFSCVVKDITERKKTERVLNLMQMTVEKTGDQAHWLTPEGRFSYANEATCAALGYSREEMEGMSIWEVDPNLTREKYLENYPKLKKEGSMRFESLHRAKDGRIYPVEVHCNYVYFDGEEFCCAFTRDISERKQREEALRFTQYVVDKTGDQAFWVTPEGRIHYANEAACASLEYSRSELEVLGLWDINPTVIQEDFANHWLPLKENGSLVFETVHQTKNGRIYPVEVRCNYVNFEGEEFCCAFVTDITERKQKEAALRLNQFAMDTTADQAFWVTPEGVITYANNAACASLGYSSEELVGMSVSDIDPNIPPEGLLETWESLKTVKSRIFESCHIAKDGRIYPVEIRSSYVNFDGQEYRFAFVNDISARKQAEQQLRQANLILENSPAVVFRWGATDDWPVEMVSRNVSQFGYTPEDFLSGKLSYAALVHPEDLDQLLAELHLQIERGEQHFQHEYRIVTKQGEVRWVDERTLIERDAEGRAAQYQGIVIDITERKRTELVITARMRLLQFAATHTLDELLEATLDEAEELTGSKIGFYHFVQEDQQTLSLLNWSTRTKTDFCKMQGKGLHYPVSEAGVWVDCIRQRQPVIHDDYAALPHCKGLPAGHAPVVRELVVPVFRGEKIVAVLGVGNKQNSYTQQDVEMVSLLADLAWEIAERKQAEEALENRLVALTRPLDDETGVSFEELFNPADIQRLQDDFAKATGVASLITLPDGTPLTEPSNFGRLCDLIRATPKGTANCMKSDAALGQPSASGPIIQQCLSAGLWGAGAAISVGGRHIANWLIGQVRDESITGEQMRAYARQVDADEEAIKEAFQEVPIMPRERFNQIAQALYTLAQQLSSIAYQNVQQARFITDHKRAEEALRRSEVKYRSIVEHAPFGITRSTKEGKLLNANPAFSSILKYESVEELMETVNRSSIQEVLFPRPSEREPLVENILATDSWHIFNNKLRCKDGSSVTCRIHSRRILDKDGKASAFESYQENITDHLEAEQALRESEEKFRVLAETSPVAICLYEGEHVTYVNPAMEQLFGHSAKELYRMKYWEWIHKDDQELVRSRALARLAGENVPGQYEFRCVTKDGEELDILVSAGTMKHQKNTIGVASFLDITERKRSEELVRASLAEKEVLLKEIHHRVKNNLQVVSSLLYLQAQRFSDPELQACFLESQSRICSMALAHEQLYQSKNLYEVSVKSYVENLVKQLEQIFLTPEKEIDCRLAVEDLPLDIEKVVPCGLLITELLSNAYKHAFADGRNGQVTISLQSAAGQIELAVADDGVGLPAEIDCRQVKTFGLQLVTALTNQLGGTLELERSNGTRFGVRFAE